MLYFDSKMFSCSLCPQRHSGEVSSGGSVKHLGRNRFSVSFQLEDVQKPEQDLYRCVTQSTRGSGVSNFAELIVKGNLSLIIFLLPNQSQQELARIYL